MWVYLHSIFFLVGSVKRSFSAKCASAVQCYPKSLILVRIQRIGSARMRFARVPVRHSNLGRILPRFRDIGGFLLRNWPAPISPEFWWCLRWTGMSPDRPCWGQSERYFKLFSREIVFDVFQSIPERYRQTDDLAWHNRALSSIGREKLRVALACSPKWRYNFQLSLYTPTLSAQRHRETTDDSMTPTADHTLYRCDRLKMWWQQIWRHSTTASATGFRFRMKSTAFCPR